MPLLLWIALFVLLFAVTAGVVFVFLRVLTLWRALKSFGVAVDGVMRDLTGPLETLNTNAQSFGSEMPRLEASLERLRHTLARTAVLRQAVKDVQDAFGRLTAVYPRK